MTIFASVHCAQIQQYCIAALLLVCALLLHRTEGRHLVHSKRVLHNTCCNVTRSRCYGIQTGKYSVSEGWCDVTSDGLGWLVILRRVNNGNQTIDFDRDLSEYEEGFGHLSRNGEFWYGLRLISELTNKQAYELRVEFYNESHHNQSVGHVTYSNFSIGSACEGYRLNVGGFQHDSYSGLQLLDGLTQFDNNHFIGKGETGCNRRAGMGGWWYNSPDNGCDQSDSGGVPGSVLTKHTIDLRWYQEGEQENDLKKLTFAKYELKIRPKAC